MMCSDMMWCDIICVMWCDMVRLYIDDAARMCTDISSSDVVEHMKLCHRILPSKEWRSETVAVLCEHTSSREQVEAVVKCAIEAVRLPFPIQKLTYDEVAVVCSTEQREGYALQCLRDISKIPTSSPGSYFITSTTTINTCKLASSTTTDGRPSSIKKSPQHQQSRTITTPTTITITTTPGTCMAQLASIATSKLVFDSAVPTYLCGMVHQDSLPIIQCLEKMSKRMIGVGEIMWWMDMYICDECLSVYMCCDVMFISSTSTWTYLLHRLISWPNHHHLLISSSPST